jgi:hypothetical protein
MKTDLPRGAGRFERAFVFSGTGWGQALRVSASTLLTFFGFTENQPIAVLSAAVVRVLPLRVNDWPFANFDDAVTGHQTHSTGCVDKFNVRPLIPMMVNVVSDLAEQNPFWL